MTKRIKMPKILANQWTSLWDGHTLYEKMHRDGEIADKMTGGSIVHINVDSSVTQSQAKRLITDAVREGMGHFALNAVYAECKDCGHVHKGNVDNCPKCSSKRLEKKTRIIGYFSTVSNWSKARRELDFPNRKFMNSEQLKAELG